MSENQEKENLQNEEILHKIPYLRVYRPFYLTFPWKFATLVLLLAFGSQVIEYGKAQHLKTPGQQCGHSGKCHRPIHAGTNSAVVGR